MFIHPVGLCLMCLTFTKSGSIAWIPNTAALLLDFHLPITNSNTADVLIHHCPNIIYPYLVNNIRYTQPVGPSDVWQYLFTHIYRAYIRSISARMYLLDLSRLPEPSIFICLLFSFLQFWSTSVSFSCWVDWRQGWLLSHCFARSAYVYSLNRTQRMQMVKMRSREFLYWIPGSWRAERSWWWSGMVAGWETMFAKSVWGFKKMESIFLSGFFGRYVGWMFWSVRDLEFSGGFGGLVRQRGAVYLYTSHNIDVNWATCYLVDKNIFKRSELAAHWKRALNWLFIFGLRSR